MGTFNFSAKYLSKKDSSTMLPELTEFVPATRMRIVRKVLLGLENRAGCIFSLLLNAFEWCLRFKIWNWMGTLSFHSTAVIFWDIVQTGAVWFFIPANCPAQVNRKFPVQLYVKIQIIFEPPFWICKWANHLSFLAMVTF